MKHKNIFISPALSVLCQILLFFLPMQFCFAGLDGPCEKYSIEEIENKGEFLGCGRYGSAYKVGNTVYKIMHRLDANSAPDRIQKLWNDYYREKGLVDLAVAEICHLGQCNTRILITPYIEGESLRRTNMEDFKLISNEMYWYRENFGRNLADFYVEGNIKLHPNYGALIVDFDQSTDISPPLVNTQTSRASQATRRAYGDVYIESSPEDMNARLNQFPGFFT